LIDPLYVVELIGRYSNQTNPPLIRVSTAVVFGPLARPRIHNAQKRLGPDKVTQLIADYQAGEPSTALMVKYQLGKGTVLKILKDHDVTMRRQGFPTDRLPEAIQLYKQGWSTERIGDHLGCDKETVRQALMRSGVKVRNPGRPTA
jgi:hypothetical protein